MHMWLHMTNHLIISNDKDSNSETNENYASMTVTTPAPLFAKMYMDTMHLLHSAGFTYIIQGWCLLTHYPEFCMLWKENVQTLGNWIFQDVLCHWGMLVEIVSNNSKPFVAALTYLEKKYHIKHICISGYNLCTNDIIE
jgi:hypothetical protein